MGEFNGKITFKRKKQGVLYTFKSYKYRSLFKMMLEGKSTYILSNFVVKW